MDLQYIPNINLFHALKHKQDEILSEVENLESKINNIHKKREIAASVSSNLSKHSHYLKDLSKSYQSPSILSQKLLNLSESIQLQENLITKHLNYSLESAAIPKLIQLLKLQASINSFTESFYKEKLESASVHKKNKQFVDAKNKAAELAQSLALIQIQNKEFTAAIRNNINQLSLLIEPAIEKTLNFFVVLQQNLTQSENSEFLNEKTELEDHFRSISNYVRNFSDLFEEFCLSRKEFETFSEIEPNENSVHRLEFEDTEESHQISCDRLRVSKEFIEEMKIVDEIVKVADVDAENQKLHLKSLLRIMENLESENKKWEDLNYSYAKPNFVEQNKFLCSLVNEFFQLLKECIGAKDLSISTLEKIREKAVKRMKDHKRLNSSLFNSSVKHSYIFVDPPRTEVNQAGRYRDEKTYSKVFENSPFKCIEEFNESQEQGLNHSVRIEKDSLENPEKLADDLRVALSQIRSFQEIIAELQKKEKKLQENIEDLKNARPSSLRLHFPSYIPKFVELTKLFYQFKSSTRSELEAFCKYIQELSTKNEAKLRQSQLKLRKEIEELKDLNESLGYEKDVLKDTFQAEVKKLMNELLEVKKLNKDLKDSLLKLSTKYESQNKANNELMAALNLNNGESIAGFKAAWAAQQKFINKLQNHFGIKDLETLSNSILEEKKVRVEENTDALAIFKNTYQVFDKNLAKFSTIFKNFTEKYEFKVEKCKHLLEIFKKVYENDMTGCLQEIESQSLAIKEYSVKVEELERSVIKYKHIERELQCVISTKSLELQESNENFTTLQEFTENCIRVIEEFRNLYISKEEFKDLEPAIEEILALSKEVL